MNQNTNGTSGLTPVQISKEKSRIRALLKTDGRTPEEAASYREKAMKLLEKRGWTEADLVIAQPKTRFEDMMAAAAKAAQEQAEAQAAKKAARAAKPKKPRAGGARRGPAPTYADDQVITILKSNPKRPGTHAFDRYAKYRDGMTVGQALEAGLTRDDFRWDIAHGHIQIN